MEREPTLAELLSPTLQFFEKRSQCGEDSVSMYKNVRKKKKLSG